MWDIDLVGENFIKAASSSGSAHRESSSLMPRCVVCDLFKCNVRSLFNKSCLFLFKSSKEF